MDILPEVKQPVLILMGGRDHTRPKMEERLRSLREAGQRNIQDGFVPGANHNNILNNYLSEPTRGNNLSPDEDGKPQQNPVQVARKIQAFYEQAASETGTR